MKKHDHIRRALALVVVAGSSRVIAACSSNEMPNPSDFATDSAVDSAVDGAAEAAADGATPPPPDGSGPTGTPTPIQWNTTAQGYRGMNGVSFYLRCPAMGQYGILFGTAVYTDNSSICTAALHDRRITLDAGGNVEMVISMGRSSYMGSRSGGVTSGDWDAWDGSFSFTSPPRMME